MISGYAQTILKAREKFYMKERIQTEGSGIRKVKLLSLWDTRKAVDKFQFRLARFVWGVVQV
ncbi:MAG: hypothetical protein CM15mP62_18790 [Rhodospirillaceae bacterium]|nr:MAG: hypothetical protein CM15mP62_18790 [Rhodospirillaceae bacterium]